MKFFRVFNRMTFLQIGCVLYVVLQNLYSRKMITTKKEMIVWNSKVQRQRKI